MTGQDWLSVRIRTAERGVAAGFDLPAGGVLAVLGPNGAGKTTVLEAIAGLTPLDDGYIRAGDRVLYDSAAGIDMPAAERRVGLLAQDALLFGSLSVRENVEFGPRSQGWGKAEARAAADDWLAAVGAEDLTRKRPRRLSGGQARRVAIARALAADPEVLLLDEPFAALDVAVAAQIRSMLRRLLADRAAERGGQTATVLITHDIVDVVTLADHVLVLDNGQVVDHGPVERALRRPASPFTADLAGTNMVPGHALGAAVAGERSPVALRTAAGTRIDGHGEHELADGDAVTAVFEPTAVRVVRPAEPETAAEDAGAVPVTVIAVEPRGVSVRIRAEHRGADAGDQTAAAAVLLADVTVAEAGELRVEPGDRLAMVPDPEQVTVYPR